MHNSTESTRHIALPWQLCRIDVQVWAVCLQADAAVKTSGQAPWSGVLGFQGIAGVVDVVANDVGCVTQKRLQISSGKIKNCGALQPCRRSGHMASRHRASKPVEVHVRGHQRPSGVGGRRSRGRNQHSVYVDKVPCRVRDVSAGIGCDAGAAQFLLAAFVLSSENARARRRRHKVQG